MITRLSRLLKHGFITLVCPPQNYREHTLRHYVKTAGGGGATLLNDLTLETGDTIE
jgi:hypothetical protein